MTQDITENTDDTHPLGKKSKAIRYTKSVLWHMSITPVSWFFNGALCLCVIIFGLFLRHDWRDTVIKTYFLPYLEKYDVPKISYDSLYVNEKNALVGKNIVIFDDTHKKFLSIDAFSIQPDNFFDFTQGFKDITVNHVTIFKKPVFASSKTNNRTETLPKIPFDIASLNVHHITLNPEVTGYKTAYDFKLNATNHLNNGIHLEMNSFDYKNASLSADISEQNNRITVDSTLIAPNSLMNQIFQKPFFKNTVTTNLKASVDINAYLKNKNNAIAIDVQKLRLSDAKLNLNGHIKTALYAEPFALKNMDMQLQSNKNSLVFVGDITTKTIHGTLKADNFNLVDFYPFAPDVKQCIVTAHLTINGNMNVIPNIDGTMNLEAIYRNIPLSANIIGKHHNKDAMIDLKLKTQNAIIADASVSINDTQTGRFNLAVTPQNIPPILKTDIPVIMNDMTVTSHFKRHSNTLVFSDGVLTVKKIKTKKSISDTQFTAQDLTLNFQNTPDALKITKAHLIGIINQHTYDIGFDSVLYDYYKPQSLNLRIFNQKNHATTLNATINHVGNRDIIHADIHNLEPDALFAHKLPLKITNFNAELNAEANIFASDILSTLSGTFTTDARHDIDANDNASVALKGDIKKGIANVDYTLLTNGHPAGTGTITSSNNFNHLETATDTDLKALSVFIQNTEHRLTGKIIADIAMNNGVLSGDMTLKNATYRNLLHGTSLDTMNMQAKLTADYIDIISLSAVSQPTGSINAKGIISLSPVVQSTLVINTNDLVPMKNNMITVKADSVIALTGNRDTLILKGTMKLNDLLILLPDLKANDTPNLTIIRPDDTATKTPPQIEPIPLLARIQTDIAVSVTEGAKIVGFGLEGFPYGTLWIYGNLNNPQIDGQIDIARGNIELLSKSFKIVGGGIHVKKNNPVFNVQAVHNVDNTEINLSLKGSIKSPDIVLSSKPAIPKDEIIALLFFGKNKNALSPFQGLRLANAVYQLSRGKSGAGGTFDVVGNTERLLNIDQLSVNSDANNSVSVGAGKYISDDIYIATDYNPSTSATIFRLELKLTQTLDIETRLNTSNKSTNNSEIMLRKNKDY